jgi:hypothetical protein
MRSTASAFTFMLAVLIMLVRGGESHAQSASVDHIYNPQMIARDQKNRVWWQFALRNDCTVETGFNLVIAKQPTNGRITLEKHSGIIDSSWINLRHPVETISQVRRCMGKPASMIRVFYTSNPGFTGTDELLVKTINANQSRLGYITIPLTVTRW